jgi:iron complex transport system substrate-binding protein
MKKVITNCIILALFLVHGSYALTIVDSAGNVIEIEKAERIVCLNSDCLEALMMLEAKDKIVGLGSYALQKPYAPKVPDVGKWSDPNVEAIINLTPDIVITYVQWPERAKLEDKLNGTGIKVVRLDFYKIGTIFDEFITLGKILGKEERARDLAEYWRSKLDLIKERVGKVEKKTRVYWESYTDYSAAGNGTGWNDVLILAGGSNVVSDSGYPQINAETIIEKNPDVFIKSVSSTVFKPYTDDVTKLRDFYNKLKSRPEIGQIAAGKNERVYVVCSDMLHSTFGLVAETAYAAKILYPPMFKDLKPEELHREYIQSLGLNYTGTWVYPQIPAWQFYDEDYNGKIQTRELIIAIRDWLDNKIVTRDLIVVIQKWLT